MRNWVRTRAGVVTTGTAAIIAGGAVWLAAVGGFGFHNAAVIAASSCTSSCAGSVTLTATVPPQTASVAFKVDGSTVSTDESAPYSASWDTTAAVDGSHSVVAVASGTGGSTSSATVTVSTSNGVSALGNVWVSTTGNDATGTRSASPVALGAAQPFATPAAAWAAASAGDTIRVADGDYTTGCAITGPKASDTTFVGSTSARFICGASIGAGNMHVVFDGLSLASVSTSQAGSFVTVKNGAITCTDSTPYQLFTPDNFCNAKLSITGTDDASNWTFQNESIGPTYDSANCGNSANDNLINVPIHNFTFTNVTFHDERYADCVARSLPQQHAENMVLEAPFRATPDPSTNVTFDRVTFYNGPLSGKVNAVTGVPDGGGADSTELQITAGASGGAGDFSALTIENSLFYGAGNTGFEGNVDVNFSNGSIVEYSVFPNGGLGPLECTTGNCPSGYTDLTLRGVIEKTGGTCPDGGTLGVKYQYNYWYKSSAGTPSKCGANDGTPSGAVNPATIFTSPSTNDYTLAAASPVIGFVPTTTGCVSDDYAGATRPNAAHATACDAGAYENR